MQKRFCVLLTICMIIATLMGCTGQTSTQTSQPPEENTATATPETNMAATSAETASTEPSTTTPAWDIYNVGTDFPIDQYIADETAKDPAAAARLIAYGFSPTGTMQTSHGTPGEDWISKNGAWTASDAVKEAYKVDAAAYNMEHGIWDYYSLWYAPMPDLRTEPDTTRGQDQITYDRGNTDPYAFDSTLLTYNMAPSASSVEGIANATLSSIASEANVAAITAKTEQESASIIEKMLQDIRNTKDLDKLEAFLTQQYQKNIEKFGGPKY